MMMSRGTGSAVRPAVGRTKITDVNLVTIDQNISCSDIPVSNLALMEIVNSTSEAAKESSEYSLILR